jgi:uncharacterized protein (DUF2267 family)
VSTTGLSQIDQTVQLTNVWLGELMDILGLDTRAAAYRALRTVLTALRDHLPVNDAAHLAAQLPLLVRGLFYEGWHPAATPVVDRGGEAFYCAVEAAFSRAPEDPEEIIRAVFALLERHVTEGEVDHLKKTLPAGVRRFWN